MDLNLDRERLLAQTGTNLVFIRVSGVFRALTSFPYPEGFSVPLGAWKCLSPINQIECWFSILVRRLLKRSSFTSTEHLKQQILDFITYFNRTLAKPFVWKFVGFPDSD